MKWDLSNKNNFIQKCFLHYNLVFAVRVFVCTTSKVGNYMEEKNIAESNIIKEFAIFKETIARLINDDLDSVKQGAYSFVYFDILHFKAINDIFTPIQGDKFLEYMQNSIRQIFPESSLLHRFGSDRFILFTNCNKAEIEKLIKKYLKRIADYKLSYEIVSNIGIYITNRADITVDGMIDRAIIAHSFIKGSYSKKYNFYETSQRMQLLGEQEITGRMAEALASKEFVVYFQPQYDHSNGSLVGAEALVRWIHPKRGLISPNIFIPVFEKNGFITKLDFYVFEETCKFIRQCEEKNVPIVPISINICRNDIYQEGFVESLEKIREKYEVPVRLLRIEITEYAVVDGIKKVNEIISELHSCGYIVEMDDFGSAYSSLNALKDINLDILKLDMKFLSDNGNNQNGAVILSSVVRMAKWLGFPVIAEGVEQKKQADYLLSIGCSYIQGYYYAKPMPADDFEIVLASTKQSCTKPSMFVINSMKAGNFWNPDSLETLIFSNYVGGAAILDYKKGNVEVLRVNRKYIQEIGQSLTEQNVLQTEMMSLLDEENKQKYIDMLERAISSEEEEECETWRLYDKKPLCIRSTVRLIGKSVDSYLFYTMIRNVTTEKEVLQEMLHREKVFRATAEQLKLFYWEYDIKTKKMYPCVRCMQELHFPPVLENYPSSAIERGVFPMDIADFYEEVHKRLEKGEPYIEIDIPLTEKREMYRLRYTTEFDKYGNPVKAYGSAIKI
jgi:EAL domain-containing protein (putative c-di-GMP-specific phosphodiesterase class I)/GGDEF domain-containing protein